MSDEIDLDFDIDFGNVQEFEPLPSGDYLVTVSDVVVQKTKNGSGRNLILSLEVEQPTEYNGRSFKTWVYIYPENPFGLKKCVEAVLDMDLEGQSIRLSQIVPELQGKTVGVTMEEGSYGGKATSNVIAWWSAVSGTRGVDVPSLYNEEPF